MFRYALHGIAALAATCAALPAAAQTPVAPGPAASAEGFRLDRTGTLVHKASGVPFPRTLAGFTRTGSLGSDPSGQYVTVEYRRTLRSADIVARISLVHIEKMSAAEHYVIMKPLAKGYFDKIEPISEGPIKVAGLKPGQAWRGTFRGNRNGIPFAFSLTTVDLGYWGARVATAYAQADRREAGPRLDRLIAALGASSPIAPGHHRTSATPNRNRVVRRS